MDFQTITSWLFIATMILPLVGLSIYVSSRRGKTSDQAEHPSPVVYGSSIVIATVVGYGVGVSIGIGVGCSQGAGNLCGLVGIFIYGPLFALGAAVLAPLVVYVSAKHAGKSVHQNDSQL